MKLFSRLTHSPAPVSGEPAPQSGRGFHALLAIGLLITGGLASWWLLSTGPAAKEHKPKPDSVLVEIRPVDFGPGQSLIEAFGTVIPARQVELRSQVSGEVVELGQNLVPGALVGEGELLVGIDPADHNLALRQAAAELTEAEAALRLEQGNQEVARLEYALSGEKTGSEDLVLRRPQLASAGARLDAARAGQERARLDLARTRIQAPFAAVIEKKEIDLGSRLVVNSPLLSLVAIDRYWVEVLVPVGQLAWITIPGKGKAAASTVRVYDPAWEAGAFRIGRVLRLAGGLEEQGRLARLLVAVDDPLGLKQGPAGSPRLFTGAYVRAEIEGRKLERVVALERSLLRDGDQVWLMDQQDKLEIRPVKVAFRNRDLVLISAGLNPGERLVVSDLAAPVAGLPLRTPEASKGEKNQKSEDAKKGDKQ